MRSIRLRLASALRRLPVLPPTRPISTMDTAKAQLGRQPGRDIHLLSPVSYNRHDGPAAWIDPVVLRAITISRNNIGIPVRRRCRCRYDGHPGDAPFPWFTNNFGLRLRCGTKRDHVAQDQPAPRATLTILISWPPCYRQIRPNLDIPMTFGFAPLLTAYRTSKALDPQRLIL